jgi:predicted GNAT family acetyltransferase
MAIEVRKAEDRSRYELLVDDQLVGVADYVLDGDRIVFPHTEIDSSRRGQGWGAVLVRGALDDVRGTGRQVVPTCWLVRAIIDANHEYADLLAA